MRAERGVDRLGRFELLTGWGRATATRSEVIGNADAALIADLVTGGGPPLLARGEGRSYGDAAMNAGGRVVLGSGLTGIGPVSPSGEVRCGAGVTLEELLDRVVGQGWFLPVTPGIRRVSIGGAIAADVHGKNHLPAGAFGAHVRRFGLIDGLGRRREVTPGDGLFAATVGGMGLTGIVTDATLALRPIETTQLRVRTDRTPDLDATLALLDADDGLEHRVAWLDCLAGGSHFGRGVVTRGQHVPAAGLPGDGTGALAWAPGHLGTAPGWAPRRLLTHGRVRLFNAAYFAHARRSPAEQLQPLDAFFYPLEAVAGWNRLYGRDGFVQYQCLVPDAGTLRAAVELLQRHRAPSFLAVLKRMGAAGPGLLAFPGPGWSLAVDLPADARLAAALDELDELVAANGGRVYLAKDSRLGPRHVAAMFPRVDDWRAARESVDPYHRFDSDLARRLGL